LKVRWFSISVFLLALALVVAACGDSEESGGGGSSSGGGKTLTVYSSLPLQGASRSQSEDVIKGEKLALKQAGNKAGDFTIKYVSLDDATAAAGKWEAQQTSANARKAAQDDTAIAYLGEFNSGASAISIPITNEAGLLQVSPANTQLGLTKSGPGATQGEPDKYYPSGERNYGRVVPVDIIQGAAQAQYMKGEGVKKVYVLDDTEVYGQGVAANTTGSAKKAGLTLAGSDSWDGKAANYRALASKVKSSGADAVFLGGIFENNGPQLSKDLYAAVPNALQFCPDGFAYSEFTKELDAKVQKQLRCTAPTVSPDELPPAGQKFYDDFLKTYNKPKDEISPYAVYGYEAMSDVLDAIKKGGDDKAAVIKAFFDTKKTDSVLGPYEIDDDGDTTLTLYGAYTAKGGKLVFSKALKPQG
jgi:branched-chain amino acid transport system substrate-binding protein